MNVFDFDGTIYDGDSTKDFFFYCLKNYKQIRGHIFPVIWYGIGFGLRIVKKKIFKQKLLSFVSKIDDIDNAVISFWKQNDKKIKKFYLEMKQSSDVIISASPEFLLRPICNQLGVSMLATRVDNKTGLFDGENCHGQEKVRRFYEVYPDGEIDEFYSDLYCDTPLARLSKKAYIVKGERLTPWKKYK